MSGGAFIGGGGFGGETLFAGGIFHIISDPSGRNAGSLDLNMTGGCVSLAGGEAPVPRSTKVGGEVSVRPKSKAGGAMGEVITPTRGPGGALAADIFALAGSIAIGRAAFPPSTVGAFVTGGTKGVDEFGNNWL